MKRLAILFAAVVVATSLTSAAHADLVAKWTSFPGTDPYPANSGTQAGSAMLDLTFGGGTVFVTGGADLEINAVQFGWGDAKMDLLFSGVGLPGGNFSLDYGVQRINNGSVMPPTDIVWTWSTDGGSTFVPLATDNISTGPTTRSISFSDPSAVGASSLVLHAIFTGAVGGGVGSTLRFNDLAISAVPEPSAFLFLGLATLLATGIRFYRNRS